MERTIAVDPARGDDRTSVIFFDGKDEWSVPNYQCVALDEIARALGISPECLKDIADMERRTLSTYTFERAGLRELRARTQRAYQELADGWVHNLLSNTFTKTFAPFCPVRTANTRKRKQRRQIQVVLVETLMQHKIRGMDVNTGRTSSEPVKWEIALLPAKGWKVRRTHRGQPIDGD